MDLFAETDVLSEPVELLIALAIGLLIGMEREWRRQGEAGGPNMGLRTFGLIGLVGGLAGLLHAEFGSLTLPAVVLAVAVLLLLSQRGLDPEQIKETTTAAALATLLLGALATAGRPQLAVAAAVLVTMLLHLKPALHGLVRRLSELEMHAVVRLLVISLVVLPVLPDRGYGPYEAINPRGIWWYVVLLSLLSFAGYLAIRILGERLGTLATGFFGGLASSTATTVTLARQARETPQAGRTLAAGVAVANAVMPVRMAVVAGAISPALGFAAAWPLGLAASAAVAMAGLLWWLGQDRPRPARRRKRVVKSAAAPKAESKAAPNAEKRDAPDVKNPFDLGSAIKFALLLAVILLAAKFFEDKFGDSGLLALAGIAGLADVDAITLSVAKGGVEPNTAVLALLIAAFANSLVKGGFVIAAGGGMARWGTAILGAMILAGGLGYLIPAPWAEAGVE